MQNLKQNETTAGKFYSHVTAKPKLLVSIFFLLAVICAVLSSFVSVNYDINDYLPEDSPSTVAIDVMGEEFDGGIPNVRLMIDHVTIPEALQFKQKLKNIEGVTEVTWLDDQIEITAPLETADTECHSGNCRRIETKRRICLDWFGSIHSRRNGKYCFRSCPYCSICSNFCIFSIDFNNRFMGRTCNHFIRVRRGSLIK